MTLLLHCALVFANVTAIVEPSPGDESGRTDVVDGGDSAIRVIGRGVLFVPKLVLTVALAPERGAVWAYDRYRLEDRFYRTFFSADRTIGLYPTATYESSTGLMAGLHFQDIDVFGAHERLVVHATTGAVTGESYRTLVAASLHSGDRWSSVQLGLDASFAQRPDDPFYGIGNGSTAMNTPVRWQEERVGLSANARVAGDLHVIGSSALTSLELDDNDVSQLSDDAELRFDSRRASSEWEPPNVHSSGTLAMVSLGRVTRLDAGADFWRYGVELQHYLRIAKGPRLISVRFRGDAVSGSRDEVPVLELPSLGGGTFLRGYPLGRFHDRVAAVGSVTYEWDLSRLASAYVFTDAGRVFPSLDDVTTRDLRVGYGVGIELHTYNIFLVEGSVASSIDGGVFFNLSLNPVLNAQPRWR